MRNNLVRRFLHVSLPDVKISIALGVVHDLHLEREELVKCLQGIEAFVEGENTTGSDDKSASSIYTRSKKIRLTKRVKCRGATETYPPLMNQRGLDYSYRVLLAFFLCGIFSSFIHGLDPSHLHMQAQMP